MKIWWEKSFEIEENGILKKSTIDNLQPLSVITGLNGSGKTQLLYAIQNKLSSTKKVLLGKLDENGKIKLSKKYSPIENHFRDMCIEEQNGIKCENIEKLKIPIKNIQNKQDTQILDALDQLLEFAANERYFLMGEKDEIKTYLLRYFDGYQEESFIQYRFENEVSNSTEKHVFLGILIDLLRQKGLIQEGEKEKIKLELMQRYIDGIEIDHKHINKKDNSLFSLFNWFMQTGYYAFERAEERLKNRVGKEIFSYDKMKDKENFTLMKFYNEIRKINHFKNIFTELNDKGQIDSFLTAWNLKQMYPSPLNSIPVSIKKFTTIQENDSSKHLTDKNLSDGEQSLLAFFIWQFVMQQGEILKPDIVLLDEPECRLNVTLQRAFVKILNFLTDQKIQVIGTTNNPLFVSLFEEKNLFYINQGHVSKKDKAQIFNSLADKTVAGRNLQGVISFFGDIGTRPKNIILLEGINDEGTLLKELYQELETEHTRLLNCESAEFIYRFIDLPFKKQIGSRLESGANIICLFDNDEGGKKGANKVYNLIELNKGKMVAKKQKSNIISILFVSDIFGERMEEVLKDDIKKQTMLNKIKALLV